MINTGEVYETIKMIDSQNLDVRTVTMAISLFDCITDSKEGTAEKVYRKIKKLAGNLVKTGNDVAAEYGIPIVNKRVSVTPVSLIGAASGGYEEIGKAMDRVAEEIGIDFIGGDPGRTRLYRNDPVASGKYQKSLLVRQRRQHEERHKYGRRENAGRKGKRTCLPYP